MDENSTVFLLELDYLKTKTLNGSLGHVVGFLLLQEVA
jgi:GGDEF domain-containing protein